MTITDTQFVQASTEWDTETIYSDLKYAKGKPLTPVEKLHLRGLLCGHSPSEIAEILNKSPKGVEVELSKTVYQYVKCLLEKTDDKVENWRNIAEWLEEAGYKNSSPVEPKNKNALPINASINVSNISLEKDKVIIIDLNIKLAIPIPSEILGEDSKRENQDSNLSEHS